ncbi:MAG: hypothetical protein IVW51_15430 [Thermaceae bacterium]|nr:hypothetical protein [Thermaceae bacterium]
MSLFTPITVTPVNPAGPNIILPMPDAVNVQGSSNVTFTYRDPWPQTDLPLLLAGALSQPAEKIVAGRTLFNSQYAIVNPPGVLCDVTWGDAEPFGGGIISHTARGVLALSSSAFDRNSRSINLILYICSIAYLWGGGSRV